MNFASGCFAWNNAILLFLGGLYVTLWNTKCRFCDIIQPTGSRLFFVNLKGQCHEIFDPRFFRQSIAPRPLINTLKYYRILFRIRRAIRSQTFFRTRSHSPGQKFSLGSPWF
jgi:hypothetical protein